MSDSTSHDDLPLISVILPTKNRCEFLPEAIGSAIDQSYTNVEIIAIDDGSSDETWSFLSSFSSDFPALLAFRQKASRGLAAAMNLAIGKAHGDLVFVHSDRIVLEETCLHRLYKTLTTARNSGRNVVAVAPRFGNLEGPTPKSAVQPSGNIVELGGLTGEIYHDFSRMTSAPVKIPMLHAYALLSKGPILSVGGYSMRFRGSHWRVESDLYLRLRLAGYELFYEPRAAIHPRVAKKGGSRVGRLQKDYYSVLNHAVYLLRNYRVKSLYMIPAFAFMSVIPEAIRIKVLNENDGVTW